MNTKKLLFYLLAGILGGCIPVMSLNPLFTDKEIAFDENLIGTWVDADETTWQFSDANKPEKAYKLIFTDDEGKKGLFVAHLVKLENNLFLDVYPDEMPWNEKDPNTTEWLYNTLFLVPAHAFIKINSIEPQLKMMRTDEEKMRDFLKAEPNAVEHILVEDKPVLTTSTKELQAFVLKYVDDSKVFSVEIVLNRKETKAPQESVGQKRNESKDPNKS